MSKNSLLYIGNVIHFQQLNELVEKNEFIGSISISKHHYLTIKGLGELYSRVLIFSKSQTRNKLVNSKFNNIEYFYSNNSSSLFNLFYLLNFIRKNHPHVIMDALIIKNSLMVVLLCLLLKVKYTTFNSDIPQFMTNNKVFIFFSSLINKFSSGFIFVSVAMNEIINKRKKPFIVVDTIVDDPPNYQAKTKEFSVFYSGYISEMNGVDLLCEAFLDCNFPNSSLTVIGEGKILEDLRKKYYYSKIIKIFGKTSNDVIINKQVESWLLVNPRILNQAQNNYSFPIKLSEYMLSGSAVISTKLPYLKGVFDEFIYYFLDDTLQSIKLGLREFYSKSFLHNQYKSGKDFIIKTRHYRVQSGRIFAFLNQIF